MAMKRISVILGFLILILMSTLFTVDESEYVIITEFGNPVQVIKEAGLYWKLPTPLQTITRFNNRLMVYDPPASELLTLDKKNIMIDSFILWQVESPLLFLETVKDVDGAKASLSDILFSQLGAALGKHPLSTLITTTPGEMQVEELMADISKKCAEIAKQDYGIKVVDVSIKRLNFPEQNKESVFRRMRAERQRIAKKFRSEGREEALKIEAETKREQRRILSEAYREAQEIRGETDAKAISIYAEAFQQNPGFYKFLRTLESYEKVLDDKTTIVLPADSELLQLINTGPGKKKTK